MVKGGKGDDHLVVDFDQGNPFQANGLNYDGGDGFDAITIQGGSFQNSVFKAIDPSTGSISLDGTNIHYQNIEPITYTSESDTVTYQGTIGNDTMNIVTGGLIDGDQTIEIQSDEFEDIILPTKPML